MCRGNLFNMILSRKTYHLWPNHSSKSLSFISEDKKTNLKCNFPRKCASYRNTALSLVSHANAALPLVNLPPFSTGIQAWFKCLAAILIFFCQNFPGFIINAAVTLKSECHHFQETLKRRVFLNKNIKNEAGYLCKIL